MENELQPDNGPQPIKPNPLAHAMKYGLGLGACFSADFLLSVSNNVWLALLTYPLSVFIWVYTYRSARNLRDKECGGVIRYWPVVSYIAMLFFFGALIAAAVELVYLKYINPDYLENMFSQAMVLLEQLGIDLPEASIEQVHRLMRPSEYIMQFVALKCLGGFWLGILYAFFIRRKKVSA